MEFEIERQTEQVRKGLKVSQETRGWDESRSETVSQRLKEESDDYRYFPEPDLPPLVIDPAWLDQIRASLPELPAARYERFQEEYGLSAYDASLLTEEQNTADYFESSVKSAEEVPAKITANWILGDLYGLLRQSGIGIEDSSIRPDELAGLVKRVWAGDVNQTTAKAILEEMFDSGKSSGQIIAERGLSQVSDPEIVRKIVDQVLEQNPDQAAALMDGKTGLRHWFFGQVMRQAGGKANPKVVEQVLDQRLREMK